MLPLETLISICNHTQALLLSEKQFNEAFQLCFVNKYIFRNQYKTYFDDWDQRNFNTKFINMRTMYNLMTHIDFWLERPVGYAASFTPKIKIPQIHVDEKTVHFSPRDIVAMDTQYTIHIPYVNTDEYTFKEASSMTCRRESKILIHDNPDNLLVTDIVQPVFFIGIHFEPDNHQGDYSIDLKSWTALEWRCRQAFGDTFRFGCLSPYEGLISDSESSDVDSTDSFSYAREQPWCLYHEIKLL